MGDRDGASHIGLYKIGNVIKYIYIDYEGMTCVIKTKCHEKKEVNQLSLYKSLQSSVQKVFQDIQLNNLIQEFLIP